MSRSPLGNPYRGEDGATQSAFEAHVEDHERRENQAGRIFAMPLIGIAATTLVPLIPRVPADGFDFGRVTFTFTADLAMDATNYWTFALYRRRLVDGVSVARPVVGGSWATNAIGMTAYRPYAVEYNQPLDPGEVLELVVTKANAGATFTAGVQVQETFGPEE